MQLSVGNGAGSPRALFGIELIHEVDDAVETGAFGLQDRIAGEHVDRQRGRTAAWRIRMCATFSSWARLPRSTCSWLQSKWHASPYRAKCCGMNAVAG